MSKTGNSPGPGNYELPPSAFASTSKFYIGKKISKARETTTVPGAGAYDPDIKSTIKSLPSYSMRPKVVTLQQSNMKSPAPGTYEVHLKDRAAAPKYGFGSSTR